MKNYFLTDLDGTLLRNDASLSKYTIDVISTAIENDFVISFATARGYVSSNKVASAILWKYPLVLYNGALIYDPIKKTMIDGYWLDSEIVNNIIEIGKTINLTPMLFCLDLDNRERVLHEKLVKFGYKEFYKSRPNDKRFKEIEKLISTDQYRTLIITYIGLFDELEPLKKKIKEIFTDQVHIHFMRDNYIKDHYFLEITHPKSNKEEGIKLWSELIACNTKDITVFGDNLNDLAMFYQAGKSIAVENAQLQVLELADEIIDSNENDGVAQYINKILNLNI
ncbi:Cof-type HAD-IIB family hydrolase [Natronospora cellulosivora (SeqCode)]